MGQLRGMGSVTPVVPSRHPWTPPCGMHQHLAAGVAGIGELGRQPCAMSLPWGEGVHSPFTGAQSSSSRARTRTGAGLGPMAAEPGDASAGLGGVRGS